MAQGQLRRRVRASQDVPLRRSFRPAIFLSLFVIVAHLVARTGPVAAHLAERSGEMQELAAAQISMVPSLTRTAWPPMRTLTSFLWAMVISSVMSDGLPISKPCSIVFL